MPKSIRSHHTIVSFFFFYFFFIIIFSHKNRGWELCLGWMKLKFEGIQCLLQTYRERERERNGP